MSTTYEQPSSAATEEGSQPASRKIVRAAIGTLLVVILAVAAYAVIDASTTIETASQVEVDAASAAEIDRLKRLDPASVGSSAIAVDARDLAEIARLKRLAPAVESSAIALDVRDKAEIARLKRLAPSGWYIGS